MRPTTSVVSSMLASIALLAPPGQAADPAAPAWRQRLEIMPLASAPHGTAAASATPALAPWIWGPDERREYRLTKSFRGNATAAVLVATCDNRMQLFINGTEVAASDTWEKPLAIDVTRHLRDGDNELVAVVGNAGGLAGFSCRLVLTDPDGGVRVVESDASWSAFDTLSPPNPVALRVVAEPGKGPWGDVLAGAASRPTDTPPFTVPAGFRVERLVVVPRDELGSWVALTTDSKGRIIASDQGDKGLVRITPAPLDGSGETLVEKIPVPLSSAQGLLWAFDSLYVVCNGGPGSGLYRVTDANADDTLDTVEKLRVFSGGGEHGPHNILLSPDGQRLFIICGNHTKTPFAVKNITEPQSLGGIRPNQRRVELPPEATSRLPANWDEDSSSRVSGTPTGMPSGFSRPGAMSSAPILMEKRGKSGPVATAIPTTSPSTPTARCSSTTPTWNGTSDPRGIDRRASTMPRAAASSAGVPARASGRRRFPTACRPSSTSGPARRSAPPFGYGAKFPAKYQKAFFVCDWTFGTMYAIHLTPDGSTYKGEKEEFVSRTPLPLTDMTIGQDGALYFAVGGRGGQRELYRVVLRRQGFDGGG
jgi:hypothetical protein